LRPHSGAQIELEEQTLSEPHKAKTVPPGGRATTLGILKDCALAPRRRRGERRRFFVRG